MSITMRGPLFDGRALVELKLAQQEIAAEIAKRAEQLVDTELSSRLQNPTGHYQSQIKTEVKPSGEALVSDSKVVYGPWLEGTSSRNQTTRFKGYASFRKSRQKLEREAKRIADKVVAKHVRKMG